MSKYYVTMTDKFMSGWGRAEGKISKFVIECDSYESAERIQRNAEGRSEMKHVNLCTTKPNYNSRRYYTSWKHESDLSGSWVENDRTPDDEKKDSGSDNLKAIGMVMAMGEIFGSTQSEKNDWKTRMLKAGLDGKGLIMPDDWDQLSEEEKDRRLSKVQELFVEGK